MICRAKSKFPYPILSNHETGYKNPSFILNSDLMMRDESYELNVSYSIDCDFIEELIRTEEAEMFLLIQSRDNKTFRITKKEEVISIPFTRLDVSKRTSMQLIIYAKEELNFNDNHCLEAFYEEHKALIKIPKGGLLGFSNIVYMDDSVKKPLDLFEKNLNRYLESEIDISLQEEVIVISFKNDDLQFKGHPESTALNYPYIYMGLQKALYSYINKYSGGDEWVDIENGPLPTSELEIKLHSLMRNKGIRELDFDNVDEVIDSITDKMLSKYVNAVKRLSSGN